MLLVPAAANLSLGGAPLGGRLEGSQPHSPAASELSPRGGEALELWTRPRPLDEGSSESGDEAGRAHSRFGRLLEEKLRRLEEREPGAPARSRTGARPDSDQGGDGPEQDNSGRVRGTLASATGSGLREPGGGETPEPGANGRGRLPGRNASVAPEPGDGARSRGGLRRGTAPEVGATAQPSGTTASQGGSAAVAAIGSGGAAARGAESSAESGSGADRRRKAAGSRSSGPADSAGQPRKEATFGGVEAGAAKSGAGSARLVVVDLGRSAAQRSANGRQTGAAGAAPERTPAAGRRAPGPGGQPGGGGSALGDLAVLRPGGADKNAREAAEGPGRPQAGERDFATLLRNGALESGSPENREAPTGPPPPSLLRAFQERLIPEFVRHTGIILKEGGSGEIRLLLRPESLGSVRIRLALSETSLEGRIVVENSTVKDLVEASLDHLRQALRAGGFQSASLEVAVGHRQFGDSAETPVPVARIEGVGSRELETAVPQLLELITAEATLVNLFA